MLLDIIDGPFQQRVQSWSHSLHLLGPWAGCKMNKLLTLKGTSCDFWQHSDLGHSTTIGILFFSFENFTQHGD